MNKEKEKKPRRQLELRVLVVHLGLSFSEHPCERGEEGKQEKKFPKTRCFGATKIIFEKTNGKKKRGEQKRGNRLEQTWNRLK